MVRVGLVGSPSLAEVLALHKAESALMRFVQRRAVTSSKEALFWDTDDNRVAAVLTCSLPNQLEHFIIA
jgi:hypothetical protein